MLVNFSYNGRLYLKAESGDLREMGVVPEDIIAAAEAKAKWQAVRAKRDRLLTASDWTQMPDSSQTDAQKAEWATYRQALRDIPQKADTPEAVTWPDAPAV